eukprot:1289123-Rhodomonas_salina.2
MPRTVFIDARARACHVSCVWRGVGWSSVDARMLDQTCGDGGQGRMDGWRCAGRRREVEEGRSDVGTDGAHASTRQSAQRSQTGWRCVRRHEWITNAEDLDDTPLTNGLLSSLREVHVRYLGASCRSCSGCWRARRS